MKKGFTLIELIVVIGIIAILIGSISFFRPKEEDKKIKFGKECSNYIFQEILNEKNNIEKNKTINSGGQILSHLSSNIALTEESTGLSIKSYYDNNIEISKDLTNSDGLCLAEHISYRNNYIIKPNKNFSIKIQKNNISITNNGILSVCTIELQDCIEISTITYNKANNKFEQQSCSGFSGENCTEWER